MTTRADLVAEWLRGKGVRYAYGVIGGGNVTLWDAIARRKATTLVCCHHEQAAGMAATYHCRVRGTL